MQAASGSLHVARKDGPGYVLAHTVNVERLDLIVELPASDTFVRQMCGSPVPVQLEAVSAGTPWIAWTSLVFCAVSAVMTDAP